MSTNSLRRDHDLIEKVIKSMETTIQLLVDGKEVPESIMSPVIDFSKGMPRNMGPIAMMLMDHERSREIAKNMEESAKEYFESGNSTNLVNHMKQYVEHITEHLWKENNRLFMMAEARIADRAPGWRRNRR